MKTYTSLNIRLKMSKLDIESAIFYSLKVFFIHKDK